MKSFYAHTIHVTNFSKDDFEVLEKILQSGYVLSRNGIKDLGFDMKHISRHIVYNGTDYVSLCDLKRKHQHYSAYNMFTSRGLSLLFDHSIPVIKTIYINDSDNFPYSMQTLAYSINRYSDLEDEVQVRDGISLDYLRGLCLSLSLLESYHHDNYVKNYLNSLQELLKKYNLNVPIYDINNGKVRKIKKL